MAKFSSSTGQNFNLIGNLVVSGSMTSASAHLTSVIIANDFKFQKQGQSPILLLDQNALSSTNNRMVNLVATGITATNGSIENLTANNTFTFKKTGNPPILLLDQNALSSMNNYLVNLTVTGANVSSLTSGNLYFSNGITTINPTLSLSVTASLGNAQAGIVNIQNQGLIDGMNFNITVETGKVSSVSSVIHTSLQTAHDFSSGVILIPRITSIETGKFNYGIYVNDPLGSAFNDNFSLHFMIINSSGS